MKYLSHCIMNLIILLNIDYDDEWWLAYSSNEERNRCMHYFFNYEVATLTHEGSFLVCNVYLCLHVYL